MIKTMVCDAYLVNKHFRILLSDIIQRHINIVPYIDIIFLLLKLFSDYMLKYNLKGYIFSNVYIVSICTHS